MTEDDEELGIRIGKAIAIKRALHYSVVVVRELSEKSKALNFRNSLCPFPATVYLYGRENSVMTERVQSQVQVSRMRFLHKNQKSYIIDKVRIAWDSKISRAATSSTWKIST